MMGRFLHVAKTPLIIAVVGAAMFFGVKARYGSYGDYYFVDVELPRAGQLMRVGADVRERGVLIGSVTDIRLEQQQARLTLRIQKQYPVPRDAQAYVDLKTLLGDKFVDLRFEELAPPYLEGGETIPGNVGPELEDVLVNGLEVLRAVNPDEAATIIHELAVGAQGHGEDIARGLQANAELSTIFAETLEPQLRGLHAFHVIFEELRHVGVDMNELADAINEGVPVYASAEAHRHFRQVLEALVPMSTHLADLLIFNRDDWDRMMDSGDRVLQTIAERPQGLHDLVHGLYRYVFKLGGEAPHVGDGRDMAPFVNFFSEEDEEGGHRQSRGQDLVTAIRDLCGLLPAEERRDMHVCSVVNR
jgi:phospholipid/cholesterol/gamma-HCH transport system substrate-binding protein